MNASLGIPASSDYAVSVNGHPVAVYAMPTRYGQSLENGKPVPVYDGTPLPLPMCFACADIGGSVPVTVEIGFLPVDDIRAVTVHPLSCGIALRREGARVTFEVDRPGTVTLMVNGDHTNRPLHLFFSPPVEAPPEGAIVFGPGYHDLGYDNPITLTDGQTLYLAPVAWVEGIVRATGARDIRIMGRGACMFQLSPTEIGVVPLIRGNSSRLQTVDLLMGSDLLILDQVDPIGSKAVIPLTRTERGIDPRNGKPMLLMKTIACIGFVPVGALTADGTPHPHAGTGFGLAQVFGVPLDENGKAATYGWWLADEPYMARELQQYRYDGKRFRIEKTEAVPVDGLLDGWVFLANPLFNLCIDGDEFIGGFAAIPVGDTPLHPMELTGRFVHSTGLTSGVGRFRRLAGGWRLVDFQVVPGAENLVEHTLVRGPDGGLYFSGRGRAASNLNTVSLWRSTDDSATWERVLHVPDGRAGTPVSINRALDGSLYFAGNPNCSVNSVRTATRLEPVAGDAAALAAGGGPVGAPRSDHRAGRPDRFRAAAARVDLVGGSSGRPQRAPRRRAMAPPADLPRTRREREPGRRVGHRLHRNSY